MKAFLDYVAQDIIDKYGNDLSHVAIVFPNKRASLFLNERLMKLVGKPMWSPSYITISELFRQHSKMIVGDQIKLICDLYHTFIECTGLDETLDHFYSWGQLLLADFDDIDKNMADAKQVFANLKDIHEYDDISYLTDNQKEMLKIFFSNFSDDNETELKKRFLNLWSHFNEIYDKYNSRIEKEGILYEGALYRKVVCNEVIDFKYDTYLFVGFNVLQKVEQRLFSRLKKEHKAKFYWDFDKYYMNNNEAGHYIKQYLNDFPNELDNNADEIYNNLNKQKKVTYISATTENIQARYISYWLRQDKHIEDGKKTAIVMCDENILQTVIHCLPPEVNDINVTTGYPLSQSPIASLIYMLISLQTVGHVKDTDKYRLHYVNVILRHPYSKLISPRYMDVLEDLKLRKRYYPSRSELSLDEGLNLLFCDLDTFSQNSINGAISKWILSLLKIIGRNSMNESDPFLQESIFRMYTLINRISGIIDSGDLVVDMITFRRLIEQLIRDTSVPFHGEPAIGIQIMGVLETRNLDFDHILILSCNEGSMPKGVNNASFIPYSIRKAYELTTVENKVAIFAYYFHNLIQRASDITILYNNSTENGHTGEMSRFMLQLLVESELKINRQELQANQTLNVSPPQMISKNKNVLDILYSLDKISPTAINRYIRCQLQFYYNLIAGLKEAEDNDDDQIDNRIFGNIFHKSAELIYNGLKRTNNEIYKDDIERVLKETNFIDKIVDQAFKEELFKIHDQSYRPEYNGLQIINRKVIIEYIRRLLKIDMAITPFKILALEEEVYATLTFNTSQGDHQLKIGGYIDRLDYIDISPEGERIRVIDYKTGNSPSYKTNNVDEIFTSENITKKHTDYFFQTMLYSLIVKKSTKWNKGNLPVSPALLFIQHAIGNDYDPTLSFGKEKIIDAGNYYAEFKEHTQQILSEIFEPDIPFKPTSDKTRCVNCPYKKLCEIN
jgi:CRISPR/Cas system-associated exonuclease Cas4 (RecB family)